jgi:hypothetical protein
MAKYYVSSGSLGSITVHPARHATTPGVIPPSAYITGRALWKDGPEVIDTDKLTPSEIIDLEKCFGGDFRSKLEQFLRQNKRTLGLIEGLPIRPIEVGNLTKGEVEMIREHRLTAEVALEPPPAKGTQSVTSGHRQAQ